MQPKSLFGWWIKASRRLPLCLVCAAVGVLFIAQVALGQERTERRTIPNCTSPDAKLAILPSPTKIPVGATRTVTTTLLCDVRSLFLDSTHGALDVWLDDGDDLSGSRFGRDQNLDFLIPTFGPAELEPVFTPIFDLSLTFRLCGGVQRLYS